MVFLENKMVFTFRWDGILLLCGHAACNVTQPQRNAYVSSNKLILFS